MKGMLVFVLRSPDLGDCTNGGASSKATRFVLIGKGVPEIFAPSEASPALYLAKWYGRDVACPENIEERYPRREGQRDDCSVSHLGAWMAGGNYISTCDSRMSELLGHSYPLPVYDRKEW